MDEKEKFDKEYKLWKRRANASYSGIGLAVFLLFFALSLGDRGFGQDTETISSVLSIGGIILLAVCIPLAVVFSKRFEKMDKVVQAKKAKLKEEKELADEFEKIKGKLKLIKFLMNCPPSLGIKYSLNSDGKSYYVAAINTELTGENIIIASEHNGLPVTGIGRGIYAQKDGSGQLYLDNGVKNIIIPEGIQSIGDSVFCGFVSLENIVIPSTIKVFGDYFCADCGYGEVLVDMSYAEKKGYFHYYNTSWAERIGYKYKTLFYDFINDVSPTDATKY